MLEHKEMTKKIYLIMKFICAICIINQQAIACFEGNNDSTASKSEQKQYGCRKLSYTRRITFPGCDPFNITTKACRGFCMSFSIPIAEDLGPPETKMEFEQMVGSESNDFRIVVDEPQNSREKNFYERINNARSVIDKRSIFEDIHDRLHQTDNSKEVVPTGVQVDEPNSLRTIHRHSKRDLSDWLSFFSGRQRSLPEGQQISTKNWQSMLSKPTPDEPMRRDVISKSQCCKMTKSNEIIHIVHCQDGNHKLVTKSALSCECSFCKHI